jgi:hypothetical protein
MDSISSGAGVTEGMEVSFRTEWEGDKLCRMIHFGLPRGKKICGKLF